MSDLKKPKLEINIDECNYPSRIGGGSTLEALLTKPRGLLNTVQQSNNDVKLKTNVQQQSDTTSGLFLTEEQLKTSSKLISQAQPGVVNTYLVTVPLSTLSSNLTTIQPDKLSDDLEECELSPTYPKSINPVSIKSETDESDRLMRPPSDCITFHSTKDSDVSMLQLTTPVTRKHHLLSQVTKPVVSTNAKAALNLNEINRTQSERELMALVDGDVVSADGKSLFFLFFFGLY